MMVRESEAVPKILVLNRVNVSPFGFCGIHEHRPERGRATAIVKQSHHSRHNNDTLSSESEHGSSEPL